jgi:hypothetical protein
LFAPFFDLDGISCFNKSEIEMHREVVSHTVRSHKEHDLHKVHYMY